MPHSYTVAPTVIPSFEANDPRRTALIVIDLQNVFVEPGQPMCSPYARGVVEPVNRMAGALRAAGGLVVFTRHSWSDEPPRRMPDWQAAAFPYYEIVRQTCRPGSYGHALHPSLDVQPGDLVIDKYRLTAFLPNSSDLHAQLQRRGIEAVIITGTVTQGCCEFSARDAVQMDYKVSFVADATATSSDEVQDRTLIALQTDAPLFEVASSEQIIARLARAHAAA